MTGIYAITNLVNNKKYIGQAIDIESRWKSHIRDLNNNKHHNSYLQSSWNKYGIDSFSFSILCECKVDELNNFEIEYIEKHKTFVHREDKDVMGYNLTMGGDAGMRGRYGGNATNIKKVICLNTMDVYDCAKDANEKYKSYKVDSHCRNPDRYKSAGKDEITGEKLVWTYYDDDKPMEYYEEIKLIRLKNLKNHKGIGKNPRSKKIIRLSDGKIFRSMLEAISEDGYSVRSSVEVRKYQYSYLDEYNKICKEEDINTTDEYINYCKMMINEIKNIPVGVDNEKYNKAYKLVVCDGVTYHSIAACSRKYGVSEASLSKWLRGIRPMPQKYRDLGLMYYEDYIKLNKESEAV